MHLLIIPSWYPDEINPLGGLFFQEQAQALKNAGHRVGVIFPERKSLRRFQFKNIKSYISYENDHGIATIRKKGWRWFPRIPYGYSSLYLYDGLVLYEEYVNKYGQPDIIHAHAMFFGGVLASRIEKQYNVPFVVTEHSSDFAKNLIQWWQRKYFLEIYQNVSKLITVSPALGKILTWKYACPKDKIKFIPNLVNTDFFTINTKKPQEKNKFIFFVLSGLEYEKGHHVLLNAFASKFKNIFDTQLWIGGDGARRLNIEKQANDLGISRQVRFLGMLNREQVRDYLQQVDVFVLPSLYETFGVVIIEALASGKPVIATKCGGPECVVTDLNGLLVPRNDVESLADALVKMKECLKLYDPSLIRQDCIDRFSAKEVTKQLEIIYQEILKTKL
ncbi:glycosyltransferase [Syntrophomonas wolfei]|jgi:glycosyltransferase involved in cell wall biosynthesis|uniref:glycosyltransferase n=1 Tax=Syntrophomonas wolfei TaxID=863 RepID=UPI0023F25CA9|nr:glycosyltransferase [Syntrophomonas wolfei]